MKGMELPINVIVVVAIAVIVLLALALLYFVGFNPFGSGVSLMSLKNDGCGNLTLSYDCGRRGNLGALTTKYIYIHPSNFGTVGADTLVCIVH